MKKSLFLFLILPLLTFGQGKTTLSVQFANSSTDSCSIKLQQYFIDEYELVYKATIRDNKCTFSLPIEHAMFAKFNYNNQWVWIYLEPNVEISMNIGNDSLFKTITFSGAAASENTFLKDFYSRFQKDFDKDSVKQAIITTPVDKFENVIYDERKRQHIFYTTYKDQDKFDAAFKNYMEHTIRYNYFASLLSYPIVNANQSTQVLTVNALPEVMLEGIDSKLCNDDALISGSYHDFLFYYVTYFTSKANSFNKFKDMNLSMESKMRTAQQNLKGRSLIWYLANFLNSDCDKVSPYTVKQNYAMLGELEANGTYYQLLKRKCEARIKTKEVADKSKVSKPEIAERESASGYPKMKDLDGKYFTIDDLKGKVVYVDFWASWCGPCRAQMPASKQLHEMFTAKQLKNLVFLYISIDGSEDAWKDAVKQIGMEGKLGISPGNWNSEIAKYFQINSIPRYMLIDKKGKIVDQDAKRPAAGQDIYNDIVKLLEE